ncbi:class II fructose-bisphosphate aldolase [Salibaculum sp.]|uniref:class II fructose-bisphosphate aldolase n=1 Tax=Salibaculum sp. TaxID=2855480 RepID=UPI002B488DC4|nr:class II fructose-bisphosphate aldolase [Salibaculum sp.]HKL70240.1 class II fructose-bisphosphate aldolase [Salibaculum sp.]
MTRATLAQVLQPALAEGYAVAGVVCQGWEDARAYVAAAEAEGLPIVLQAGPGARAHMPLPVWAAIFHALADAAAVPVVLHLDHGTTIEECRQAIALGFTSVMFDGSRLPLADNIARTRAIVEMAHAAGVSCEGEIGFVGYHDGAASAGTDPEEAARFASETAVDAMAVSIGNVHLQRDRKARIDRGRLAEIEAVTDTPLVIHGGSGLSHTLRADLAAHSHICKFNIGTELRMAFGAALRKTLGSDPDLFDRIDILSATEAAIVNEARQVIGGLRPDRP